MRNKFQTILYASSLWAFVLSFTITFFLGLSLAGGIEKRRIENARDRALNIAEIQAGHIAHTVDNLLLLTETLKAILKAGNGAMPDLEQLAPDIVGVSPIRNISLAPNGIITQVYPLKGNEEALGHNLLADPKRALAARLAASTHSLTLSGPYKLKQGGTGIVGRLPVYLLDEKGQEYFWGFSCVTVDIPEGLNDADIQKLEERGYAYELWHISPETKQKQIILESNAKLSVWSERASIELPNSTWFLSVSPVKGWVQKGHIMLELTLTFIFALLVAFLLKSAVDLARSRYSLQITLTQQASNYKLLDNMNESLRAFRHDISNHMLSLSYLLEKGDLDSSKKYIRSITETLSDTTRIINTENYVFDAVLAEKLYEAAQKGIETERDITISGHLPVLNEDWTVLIGNALDNALEGCQRAMEENPGEAPMLRIVMSSHGNMLRVRISNTALRPEGGGEEYTSKISDKKNHGIGLKRMKAVVGKYGGVMETSWRDGVFVLSFILIFADKESVFSNKKEEDVVK